MHSRIFCQRRCSLHCRCRRAHYANMLRKPHISIYSSLFLSRMLLSRVLSRNERSRIARSARMHIREMQRWVKRVNLWCATIVSKLRILIIEIRMFERLRIKFSLTRILFKINLRSKYCHKFITFTFFNSQIKVIPNHSVLRYFNLQLLFVFKTP